MKPLNHDDPGCNYTTSNCVIWQGPDIPCLKLCKGDTISDVTFKLATEVCQILDILKVDAYDLSCFNLTSCKPDDFTQLLQFILNRLCAVEKCSGCVPSCDGAITTPIPTPTDGGCPDCVVAIAPCFYFQNNLGDTVTSMQLLDYITAIGNRICSNVQNVSNQQKTLNNHEQRIVVLEEEPAAVYVPPTVTPSCVLPPAPTEMDVVLTALEQQFCQLRGATGVSDALYQNISKQCAGLNSERALNGSGSTMASLQGWASSVSTVAQSLGNMWITICDMRQAIKTIQLNCCPTGCDGIELTMLAILNGDILSIYVNGTIPAGFLQCTGNTQIKITDSAGGYATYNFNLIGYLNNPSGYPVNLTGSPINTSLDLVIAIEPCLENSSTNATCKSYLSYNLVNSASCPSVTYNTTQTTISYNFTSALGDYTYNIQVWDNAGATMIVNQIQIISGVQTVSGTFTGLGIGTNYKVRVTIQATACPTCEPINCPFVTIATNPPTCPAPEATSASIP